MRYFFNIRAKEGVIPDDEGTDLPGLEQARAEAAADAKDLAREFPNGGNGISLTAIEVFDQAGHLAFTHPIYGSQLPF